MENLQQTLNLQQTYTTTLCGHVNVIFSRITKLEADIQKLTDIYDGARHGTNRCARL